MPDLIAPSSWSVQNGVNWLNAVNSANGEQNGFDIAATHNTGGSGSISQFVSSASVLGKDAWNTELHAWTGGKIGRAHVCTPVTNAHLVFLLLLEKQTITI